jgi:glycosyltransferase involved in cell wall biosynthesis
MSTLSFVIPAYRQSPFIEECICSLLNQTVACEIIIATSTPNEFIAKIASKYNITILINSNGGSIAKDWNFAINQGSGDLIVLAHQDDLYEKEFAKDYLHFYDEHPSAGLIFCQMDELINGQLIRNGKREKIKNLLRRFAFGKNSIIADLWAYRRLLGFGCPVPCPAVAFSKRVTKNLIFSDQFSVNLDWDTWVRLASKKVPFGYIRKVLMTHRIHSDAETQIGIIEKRREKEDLQLFSLFWPPPIAKLLLALYKFGY